MDFIKQQDIKQNALVSKSVMTSENVQQIQDGHSFCCLLLMTPVHLKPGSKRLRRMKVLMKGKQE